MILFKTENGSLLPAKLGSTFATRLLRLHYQIPSPSTTGLPHSLPTQPHYSRYILSNVIILVLPPLLSSLAHLPYQNSNHPLEISFK